MESGSIINYIFFEKKGNFKAISAGACGFLLFKINYMFCSFLK